MKTLKSILFILLSMSIMTQYSCLKDEELYPTPNQTITGKIDTLYMGDKFETKYYYDLETNKQTAIKHKDWDLALGSEKHNTLVKINGNKQAQVYKTELKKMTDKIDVSSVVGWKYDHASNIRDSVAIDDWFESGKKFYKGYGDIYLLDRGEIHNSDRYYLIRLVYKDSLHYKIDVNKVNANNPKRLLFKSDVNKNFTYINLEKKIYVNQEPIPKTKWDLEFTQYFYLFGHVEPVVPYLVVGTLSNYHNVKVAKLENTDYNAISKESISGINFGKGQSIIGYDWKWFKNNQYQVIPKVVYIIKNRNGFYFKLRFLAYLDKNGNSGYPTFQVEPIM